MVIDLFIINFHVENPLKELTMLSAVRGGNLISLHKSMCGQGHLHT